jgi:hypothetical protein
MFGLADFRKVPGRKEEKHGGGYHGFPLLGVGHAHILEDNVELLRVNPAAAVRVQGFKNKLQLVGLQAQNTAV